MLDRLPRSIGAHHLHTIVLVLIAGSLMSFALGQQMAHGARTNTHAASEHISGWVMTAPSRPAVAHTSANPSTALVAETQTQHESKHHDKHHGGDQGGGSGGNGGDGGGGG
ncbi:MAG TPA: hypothetical protein VGS80_01515 [Ktedonobacterales bacterium]|nr:hypothetical protein [Ktedonobacterales bacterium]